MYRKGGGDRGPVQERLYKSTKLWAFAADLEESLGTRESTKAIYEQIVDIKVATPALILNYANLMEEGKFFEEAFRVYEKGISLFKYPHVYPIWVAYLRLFTQRFKGAKVERTRDLFEQAVQGCPPKQSLFVHLLYAKYEEDYGLLKRAMDVYSRACEACATEDKQKTFFIYIYRCGEFFGVTKTREIYERAIKELSDKDLKAVCMRYAALERGLGEIDRARAVYVYGSQFCDPRLHSDYWKTWHEFEVHHGNEDTFKEMLRVRRTVTAQYSQANLMTPNVPVPTKPKPIENNNSMSILEQQEQIEQAGAKAAPAAVSMIPMEITNEEEIDLDLIDQAAAPDGEEVDVEEKRVPLAVFGSSVMLTGNP